MILQEECFDIANMHIYNSPQVAVGLAGTSQLHIESLRHFEGVCGV